MPIVARRLLATSRGSRTGAKGSKAPQSAFADRFGQPDTQLQYPQTSFPTWPSAQSPEQGSPRPVSYAPRTPPPKLLAFAETERQKKDQLGKEPELQVPGGRRRGLFSDTIGNVSELVKTSSFEAKLAIQPAMETRRQQLLAAKNNIHRFSSLPSPAQYMLDQPEEFRPSASALQGMGSSPITRFDNSSPNFSSKANSRTTRPLPVFSLSHRTLSTSSVEPSASCTPSRVNLSLVAMDAWANTQPLPLVTTPIHSSLWPRSSTLAQTPRSFLASETSACPIQSPPSTDPKAPCILVPAPITSTELCNAMRRLIQSTIPRPQVPRLIFTHSQYPTLHTVTSFNILLAHTIRVAPPYFRLIVSQMRTSGVVWDATTQKLVVRAHIQVGQWLEAIELAERTWLPEGESGASTTPLDVFTELMHFALTSKSSQEEVSAMAQRCWRLFPSHTNVNASPRLAYNVVRMMVHQGRTDQAVQLTKRLLESISCSTPGVARYCRAILGLVIRPPKHSARQPEPCRTPPFRERFELFESLLTHNPSLGLVPDAKLALCLLKNLSKSRNRGSRAFHRLGELRARYGPSVEDSAVRRLIARYAIQEGELELARAVREREELARDEPVKALVASAEAGSGSNKTPWAGDDHIPMRSHLEYIRRTGTENVKWTQLSRNLGRAEEKRRSEVPVNPRALDEGKGKHGRAWYKWLQRKRKRLLKRVKK
ncbi:hypothetical protein FRC07_013992 [Ceratobasidium sp. 392]|nr:hypothetical protein FRC07_013992 [Ceratobasidium sp. 392]